MLQNLSFNKRAKLCLSEKKITFEKTFNFPATSSVLNNKDQNNNENKFQKNNFGFQTLNNPKNNKIRNNKMSFRILYFNQIGIFKSDFPFL